MTAPLITVRRLLVEARRAEFEALPHAKLVSSAATTIENLVQENATLLRQLQTQALAFGKWCDEADLQKPPEVNPCS
jgi:hypothetical protein